MLFDSLLAGPGGWGGTAIHGPGYSTKPALLDGLWGARPVGLGQLSGRILTLVQNQARGAVGAAGAYLRRGTRIDLKVWAGSGGDLSGQVRAGRCKFGIAPPDPGAAERIGAFCVQPFAGNGAAAGIHPAMTHLRASLR